MSDTMDGSMTYQKACDVIDEQVSVIKYKARGSVALLQGGQPGSIARATTLLAECDEVVKAIRSAWMDLYAQKWAAESLRTLLFDPQTRDSQPRGLELRTAKSKPNLSFSDAVLQCLAAILDPDWLREELAEAHEHHVGAPSGYIDGGRNESVSEVERAVKSKMFNVHKPATLLLETLAMMRKDGSTNKPVAPLRFQWFFSMLAPKDADDKPKYHGDPDSQTRQDAADWTRDVLQCLAVGADYDGDILDQIRNPLVKVLFQCELDYEMRCRVCNERWTTDTEETWVLDLAKEGALKYSLVKAGPKTYAMSPILSDVDGTYASGLLKNSCLDCKKKGGVERVWVGFKSLPHHVIMQFGKKPKEAAKMQYTRINEEIKICSRFGDDTTEDTYKISATVKLTGSRDRVAGHYIAFVQSKDGQWWKCDKEEVTNSNPDDACGSTENDDRDVYLAFYVRTKMHTEDQNAVKESPENMEMDFDEEILPDEDGTKRDTEKEYRSPRKERAGNERMEEDEDDTLSENEVGFSESRA